MSKTLYLHFGTPKTGTTSLQFFLYQNRDILESYGWCYPDLTKGMQSVLECNDPITNGRPFFTTDGKGLVEAKICDALIDRVKKCTDKYNTIISDEWFSKRDYGIEFLKRICTEFSNIKLIIYIRRQDMFATSLWKQLVRSGLECNKIDTTNVFESRYLDYFEMLSDFEQFVSSQNIIVRVYEREKLVGGTTEYDFLSVIGLPFSSFQKTESKNESISGDYVEIKRLMNVALNAEGSKLSAMFGKAIAANCQDISQNDCYMPMEFRKRLLEEVSISNKNVAAKYLGISGELFSADIPKEYYIINEGFSEKEESIIKAFSAVIAFLEKNLNEKNEENKFLLQFMVQWGYICNMMNGRKLYLWGAGYRGKQLLNYIAPYVSGIIDNDPSKKGEKVHGVTVYDKAFFEQKIDRNSAFILIDVLDYESVECQVINRGFIKNKDYVVECQ